ncbi:hypothetical protein LP109_04240 [Moraxella bovis]|uniref:hypothetical protein n=1 Tax=Moraxella bovis TaxID=476 RepID=UPI002226B56A|nr:hypothetical protein [Moraxella bovis]UZA17514.1 hypothetical protein LP109_04240 [Moraxella bovis]
MGCYCGSGNPYAVCCQPYHDGTPAPTAEHLMQSRFGSFYLKKRGLYHRHNRSKPAR